jgi:hypothetical protein
MSRILLVPPSSFFKGGESLPFVGEEQANCVQGMEERELLLAD